MYQYQVGFMQAVNRAFKNYCNFQGRASRSEYWWFYLFGVLVGWVLGAPGFLIAIKTVMEGGAASTDFTVWQGVSYLWSLFILLPSFGLLFRRLHDTGRSGWYWLWAFLPVIGWFILLG